MSEPNPVLRELESQLAEYPERADGADLFRWMNVVAARMVEADREQLVAALRVWLGARSEPRTMLAVDLAANTNLSELHVDVAELLSAIRDREAFKPFYERRVHDALSNL